jgi:hypothetical protein
MTPAAFAHLAALATLKVMESTRLRRLLDHTWTVRLDLFEDSHDTHDA